MPIPSVGSGVIVTQDDHLAALAELRRGACVGLQSAVVLDVAQIPHDLTPAMFACSRVAGWSAHILEQKKTGRLFRPSARYVGPAPRSLNGDVGS